MFSYFLTDITYANTSPFSSGVQARPTTSLQLRLNHFSTLAGSVKRRGSATGESGRISFSVLACLPDARGSCVWQDAAPFAAVGGLEELLAAVRGESRETRRCRARRLKSTHGGEW